MGGLWGVLQNPRAKWVVFYLCYCNNFSSKAKSWCPFGTILTGHTSRSRWATFAIFKFVSKFPISIGRGWEPWVRQFIHISLLNTPLDQIWHQMVPECHFVRPVKRVQRGFQICMKEVWGETHRSSYAAAAAGRQRDDDSNLSWTSQGPRRGFQWSKYNRVSGLLVRRATFEIVYTIRRQYVFICAALKILELRSWSSCGWEMFVKATWPKSPAGQDSHIIRDLYGLEKKHYYTSIPIPQQPWEKIK